MHSYTFVFEDQEYILADENWEELVNDEENPVSGIEKSDVLNLLNQGENVNFDLVYYKHSCENCRAGKKEKEKSFKFLHFSFFIFTKDGKFVTSSLSKEYKETTYTRLLQQEKIDNSYLLNIIVCKSCGNYTIELEQCDI